MIVGFDDMVGVIVGLVVYFRVGFDVLDAVGLAIGFEVGAVLGLVVVIFTLDDGAELGLAVAVVAFDAIGDEVGEVEMVGEMVVVELLLLLLSVERRFATDVAAIMVAVLHVKK